MTNQITESDIANAKRIDIVQFLENNGYDVKPKGRISVCSSPFSSDSTPSLTIFLDDNHFHCFSTGKHGDTITLTQELLDVGFVEAVNMLNGTELPTWDEKKYAKRYDKRKPFNLENHITGYDHEIRAIDRYARSRGITQGYEHCFYSLKRGGHWDRIAAMGFVHTDGHGNITGVKLRNIDKNDPERFSARGKLSHYILETTIPEPYPDIYIVEGESNGAALWEYFQSIRWAAVIISFGSVGTICASLPEQHRGKKPKIIIDYDNNPAVYAERVKLYEHFNGEVINLGLDKNIDINSLWASGNLEKLNKIL